MKTLEKAGPQLTSRLKGDWIGLYRWSPNLSHCSGSEVSHKSYYRKIPKDDRKERVNQRAITGFASRRNFVLFLQLILSELSWMKPSSSNLIDDVESAFLSPKAFPQVSQLWWLVPHQEEGDDPQAGGSSSRGLVWGGAGFSYLVVAMLYKWQSGGLTGLCVCRTCSKESRSTLRWRQWIWSSSSRINWSVWTLRWSIISLYFLLHLLLLLHLHQLGHSWIVRRAQVVVMCAKKLLHKFER